ncbi:hypothetical protein RSK60_160008 [Ralstonia solanacearum K60]|nr:hypothetical protein RSK60_160008 [Ralstonia solanacearum K60]
MVFPWSGERLSQKSYVTLKAEFFCVCKQQISPDSGSPLKIYRLTGDIHPFLIIFEAASSAHHPIRRG